MNRKLISYYFYTFINLLIVYLSIDKLIPCVMNGSFWGTILWALVLSTTLETLIDKHRNFMKYYPHFEEKWLDI